MSQHKRCSRCGETKLLTCFSRHSSTLDGFQGVCKSCRNIVRNLRHSKKRPEINRKQQIRRSNLSDDQLEKNRANARDWYTNNTDRAKQNARDRRDRIRCEMITAYGGKCECCGEDEPIFLTLDHVNDDGADHRRSLTPPSKNSRGDQNYVIAELRKLGWPKDGYRLLCYNCNCGRARNGGVCPHHQRNRLFIEKKDAA